MISRSELLTATTTIAAALAGTTAWSGSGVQGWAVFFCPTGRQYWRGREVGQRFWRRLKVVRRGIVSALRFCDVGSGRRFKHAVVLGD
jgi:hypothetical protein